MNPNPIRSGTVIDDDGSGWSNWWLFSPPLSKEEVRTFIEKNAIERYLPEEMGQAYSFGPLVSSSQTYTLIKEHGGINS